MQSPPEVTDMASWLQARKQLLAREKELTRLRDEVSALRRALPRRRLQTEYVFDGQNGPTPLIELFDGCSQLVVYHFMFGPEWEAGCPSCSFWADHFDAHIPHLRARDTGFAVVSRGPLTSLQAYQKRMGWQFTWVSSANNTFNHDFAVSFTPEEVESKRRVYNFGTMTAHPEMPGVSVFSRDGDTIFHTYSTYGRGLDILNGAYHLLDLTPKGRDEAEFPFPMAWVRRHDEYGDPSKGYM